MGAVADGGGVLHILVGLPCRAGTSCVYGPLLGVTGVSVGVVIPIAHFGHDGFVVVANSFFCVELVL